MNSVQENSLKKHLMKEDFLGPMQIGVSNLISLLDFEE
jgi:hypothetical protein